MKAMKFAAFCGIAAVILVSALPAEGAGVVLRYKHKEGDVLVIKSTENMTMEMMGQEVLVEQSQTLEWKVIKVEDDGVTTFEVKLTRVTVKESVPMRGETDFDSESDEEPEGILASIMNAMVGKTYRLKRDDRGKILEVKGFTKIGKEIIKKVQELAEGNPQAAMALPSLEKQFTDKGMKKTIEQASTVWPEETVDVGTEWNGKSSVSFPIIGKVKLALKNKVETIDGGVVKGTILGKMAENEEEDDEDDEEGGGNPMAGMFQKQGAKTSGTFEFDAEKGLLLKRVQKSKVSVKSPMAEGEMPFVLTSTEELVKVTHGEVEEGPGKKKEESGKEDGDF